MIDRHKDNLAPAGSRKVTLVVCGKFHYFNFVKHLYEGGWLGQFVYSHKLSSKRTLGPTGAVSNNLWLKEYLYQGHLRLLGQRGLGWAGNLYHEIWGWQLEHVMRPASLVHFLLHGHCLRALRKASQRGEFLLADAVNSHPHDYFALINHEHESLGLPRLKSERACGQMLEELSLSDGVLAPSKFVRDSYIRHGIDPARIACIPFGVNLSVFVPALKPPPSPSRPFRVVCVAQVSPRKGHQYLLQAWKQLALPQAELHCYGIVDHLLLPVLQRIGAANVTFHGPVDRATIVAALQGSDVFVLPSVEEGMPYSILEAMACGLPVIATVNSGAEDLIVPGENGFIVPIRSPQAMAEKIEWCYRHRDAVLAMGAAARQRVELRYNRADFARNLMALYDQCLASRG